MNTPRGEFLGLPIDLLDMSDTIAVIERSIDSGRGGAHLGVNAANLVLAHDDPAYLSDLAAADVISADGQSVVWGARLLGLRVPERVTGIDLMEELLRRAARRGWGVYLLGARPRTVYALARDLTAKGVQVVGYRHGYFEKEAVEQVIEEVVESGACLLFVGMPTPEKEQLIIHHARPGGVPFSVGVGGSFDVLSGDLRRAPRLLRHLGLEWLFRLVQEPRRLMRRYVTSNLRFLMLVLREFLKCRRGRGIRRGR